MTTIPDLVAGDDWLLLFTVLRPDGTPYDLSGAPTITWTMMDKTNKRVIQSNEVTIAVTQASQGKCSVSVPNEVTTRLVNELYGHALRIVSGGITATPFTGEMHVLADPWGTQPNVQILKFRAPSRSLLDAGNQLRN